MSAEVSPLLPGERRAAARLFGDAFVDDPGWTSVGPSSARRRWHYVRRVCGGELLACRRAGGTALATRDEGRVSGVIVFYPPEALPSPWWVTVVQSPGAILAGPPTGLRSLTGDARIREGHPGEPHLYVSLLSVAPALQRGGRGRALLGAALAEADARGVPVHLDTANPANLPYYRSFGFVVTGEVALPRGAPLWYLLRAR